MPMSRSSEWAWGAAALALCAAASSTAMQWARVRNALCTAPQPPHARHPPGAPEVATRAKGVPSPSLRLLLVGDSAALGVGADRPQHALAGLLSADFPGAQVLNLSRSGAMLADVHAQLRLAGSGFDAAVLVAVGNDILRRRDVAQIAVDADALMAALAHRSSTVVWLGVANIGLAPLFVPPWSWWVSARVRWARRLFRAAAQRYGACYVDFFREARDDVFSREPLRYFAADGIHPSSSTYRHCYAVLRTALP